MWDSLESIWLAANEDKENCNAYVVPIPYADLNRDGSVAKWHCEIDLFPKNVPVIDFNKLNLKKLKPDAIFIHNPYDNYNLVTSVDSNYYSFNLRRYTKLLIYVPYYATTGKMSDSQKYLPSYDLCDYIIIQSEAMRKYFDPSIPYDKLQPLGSPKFDRVIRMCQESPKVPEKWKEKIEGRKVYFYNTSLGGMLQNTGQFLEKMMYVFKTFEGRKDSCLLWRPHPLMNATLSSMREEARRAYNQVKNYFIDHDIGIYDDTPDIDKSIALSDVYIGDTKTSVTSLFAVAGKPMFFLSNNITSLPQKDDWRGVILRKFHIDSKDFMIVQLNKLYHAPNHDFNYKYYCTLSENFARYYTFALEIENKIYICPLHTQNFLVIKDKKIERKIEFKKQNATDKDAFYDAVHVGDLIFFLPNKYPDIVCYNVKSDEIKYINVPKDFFVQPDFTDGMRMTYTFWQGKLLIISPNRREIILIDPKTFEVQQITIPTKTNSKGGFIGLVPDGETFWLLPYEGTTITRLDLSDGNVTEYGGLPKNFQCIRIPQGYVCNERPFTSGICDDKELFLAPYWGNMFVRLNKQTGEMRKWEVPFEISTGGKNGYFACIRTGHFYYKDQKEVYFMYSQERQWYKFNLNDKSFEKIEVKFDIEELKANCISYEKRSEFLPYGCFEGVFQTLKTLLDDELPGKPFDKEEQLEAYAPLNASMDGRAGEKIYQFVKEKLLESR